MAKENPTQSNFHRLVDQHRTISLMGRIDSDSCEQLVEQLLTCQKVSHTEPIKLIIGSPGGSSDAALMVCDVMAHLITAPIEALVIGQCSSAATFILLQCHVRRATPHARFVIHSSTISGLRFTMDQMTDKKLSDLLQETRTHSALVANLYGKKLGLEQDKVTELIARGDQAFNNALSAEEALAIGLITEIVQGKAGIFPEAPSL